MKIHWKNQTAYDEKDNFLAIIHQLPNDYFYGFINLPIDDVDYQPFEIKELTLEMAKKKMESFFDGIDDISDIKSMTQSNLITQSPAKFLELFSDFSIHHP